VGKTALYKYIKISEYTMFNLKKFFIILIISILNIGCSSEPQIRLHCEFSRFDSNIKFSWELMLEPSKNLGMEVNSVKPRKGKLIVDDEVYTLVLPKEGIYGMMEAWVKINRVSGASTVEQGYPPFDVKSGKNNMMWGVCKKVQLDSL